MIRRGKTFKVNIYSQKRADPTNGTLNTNKGYLNKSRNRRNKRHGRQTKDIRENIVRNDMQNIISSADEVLTSGSEIQHENLDSRSKCLTSSKASNPLIRGSRLLVSSVHCSSNFTTDVF